MLLFWASSQVNRFSNNHIIQNLSSLSETIILVSHDSKISSLFFRVGGNITVVIDQKLIKKTD